MWSKELLLESFAHIFTAKSDFTSNKYKSKGKYRAREHWAARTRRVSWPAKGEVKTVGVLNLGIYLAKFGQICSVVQENKRAEG